MSNRMTRRRFLSLAGMGAVAGLVAACSPQATPEPPTAQVIEKEVTRVVAGTPEVVTVTEVPPTPQVTALEPGVVKFSRYSAFTGQESFYKLLFTLWEDQHPGCKVEAEYAGGSEYWTRLQTQMAAGTTPDVGIGDYGRTVSYAQSGALLPLDDWIARDDYPLDPFPAPTIAQYTWRDGDFDSGGEGGHIYGLPYDCQPYILVYNKDLFDQAGVDYPSQDWTWDDFVDAAGKLTKPDEDKWGTYLPVVSSMCQGELVYSAGGEFITADYKKSGLDMPETIEAFKWAWDLVYTHQVAPRPVPSEAVNPFASGRVAMYFGGVWWINDFVNITDFVWDTAYYPKHPVTGKRTMTMQSDGWWMFKTAAGNERAWDFFKFMMSEEIQSKLAIDMEMGVPPVRASLAEKWYAKTPPADRSVVREQLEADSRKVANTFFSCAPIMGAFGPSLDKAFYDGQPVEAQMQEAAQIMNEELDKAWSQFTGA